MTKPKEKIQIMSQWRSEYLRIIEKGPKKFSDIKEDSDEWKLELQLLSDLNDEGFIKCEMYLGGKFSFRRATLNGLIFADRIKKEIEEESFRAKFTRVVGYIVFWWLGIFSAYIIHVLTR